jgi:hypothetical protein
MEGPSWLLGKLGRDEWRGKSAQSYSEHQLVRLFAFIQRHPSLTVNGMQQPHLFAGMLVDTCNEAVRLSILNRNTGPIENEEDAKHWERWRRRLYCVSNDLTYRPSHH